LIETFFQNESFTSSNTSESDLKPPNVDLFTDTSIQLGGPILRDKLWFFSGLEYYYKKEAPVGYPPSGGEAFAIAEEPKFINKLTFKMNESNTLQGFIEYETYDWSGVGAGPLRMPEATHNVDSPGWFWNAGWVSILNPETVVDVRTSGLWAEWDMLPRDLNLPGHAEITTGIRSVNHHFVYHSDRSRNQANASVSHHARDFIRGDHDFKFGVEYERSNAHQIANYAGGMWYYDYLGAPYYRVLWEGYDLSTDLNRLSAFAQDNWHITEKLNLSIGARWDHNNVTQEPSIEMTTNPIAPRVGFVYDLNGNQKTVIKAHYGHYYESAITFFTDQSGPINDVIVEWLNPATAQWEQIDRVVYQELVDPNIQQQYTQQLTAGLDQQIYGDITLGAHYIYRRDEDLVEDVEVLGIYEPFLWQNPLTGEMMTLFRRLNVGENQYVFTNPDAAYRRYHGFEITGRKRFSSRFLLSGSFVVSQSRGNLDNTDGGGTGFTRQFDSPNLNINYDGRLTNDITYEIKIMGYYDLPWGINSSWYYRHFTGDTWTPTYRVSGLVQESNVNVFLLPRGSYRLPSRNVLDWRIEKSFPFYNGNLKFTADIFNVFNTGYPLRVQNRFDLNYEEPLQFSFPREIRIGIRYQF
jgi:outer membrane receptor protein involved in Fe transport